MAPFLFPVAQDRADALDDRSALNARCKNPQFGADPLSVQPRFDSVDVTDTPRFTLNLATIVAA
jgi:hypothetical protein